MAEEDGEYDSIIPEETEKPLGLSDIYKKEEPKEEPKPKPKPKEKTFKNKEIDAMVEDLETIANKARSCSRNALIADINMIETLARKIQEKLKE